MEIARIEGALGARNSKVLQFYALLQETDNTAIEVITPATLL